MFKSVKNNNSSFYLPFKKWKSCCRFKNALYSGVNYLTLLVILYKTFF